MTTDFLERAIALAAEAHAGAQDKAGAPYILHPLRVMLSVEGNDRMIAAVLHDIVEDTPVTLDRLRELGFSDAVVAAVAALTKQPGDDADYFGFVERAGQNAIAHSVKLADIEDNMDLSRIPEPSERDEARVIRYHRARKLLHVISRERGDRTEHAPTIMPLRGRITPAEVEAECPGRRPIQVCDFYVQGAEQGEEVKGGVELGRILNVDHHAPLACMERPVTSTMLAAEYLRERRPAGPAAWVVINHTDCDSVLSSAMMMGLIEPTDYLVDASVCADHTGEEHPVADLLQALDEARVGDRTERQYLESLRNLKLHLNHSALEPAAVRALRKRAADRAGARQLVDEGNVPTDRWLAVAVLDEEIDGSFFPAFLPDAAVIMLATRSGDDSGRWIVKLRLGNGAWPGLTLHKLGVSDWDSNFGGRWNAGGNKRGVPGGISIELEEYAERLRERLATAFAAWRASQPPNAVTPLELCGDGATSSPLAVR